MQRFDEIELETVPPLDGFAPRGSRNEESALDAVALVPAPSPLDAVGALPAAPDLPPDAFEPAPRFRRLLALLTDLSLFAALTLALSPLLPAAQRWPAVVSLAGFVVVVSYYYFVGTWLLWGKTVGGAIFDVRVVAAHAPAMALRSATLRWTGLCLSLLTGGIGFALAALPSRKSLPDRLSDTDCVRAS
jgi:uncharacterized RDD family membrane protein YckC